MYGLYEDHLRHPSTNFCLFGILLGFAGLATIFEPSSHVFFGAMVLLIAGYLLALARSAAEHEEIERERNSPEAVAQRQEFERQVEVLKRRILP